MGDYGHPEHKVITPWETIEPSKRQGRQGTGAVSTAPPEASRAPVGYEKIRNFTRGLAGKIERTMEHHHVLWDNPL